MRIDEALRQAIERLSPASETARLDAEVLLARALSVERSYLVAHPEDVLDEDAVERFFASVERRAGGVPLAYITGTKEFWSLELMVRPETLVPRPETELLVEIALGLLPRRAEARVLDLGTGSGAIALALASERPAWHLTATDVSAAALAVAQENARQLELPNVDFVEGDWAQPVAGRTFDLVVCNPPYVQRDDPALAALRHEPELALTPGTDALAAIRLLARDCAGLLETGAPLLLEHGIDQSRDVVRILTYHGWTGIETFDDLTGRPRATLARRGTSEGNMITIETSHGNITVELFEDSAPVSSANFRQYAEDAFYEGTVFHRVIPGFMIQGGGLDVGLSRKETRAPIENEAANGESNRRGTLAMARTNEIDSATSQFFINLKDNAFLDHGDRDFGYAVFGRVTDGMDVVDAIAKVPTETRDGHQDVPVEPVTIHKVGS